MGSSADEMMIDWNRIQKSAPKGCRVERKSDGFSIECKDDKTGRKVKFTGKIEAS